MGPRIAIVGAGAVGGYFGAFMTRTGHDVTLIDAWPAHVEAMQAKGLGIEGMIEGDSLVQPVKAIHISDVQQISRERPVDIAMIATKSYDTVWATALIAPYLAPTGYVVSVQNCINEERIASVVGWSRTVGCVCARIASDLYEAGKIRRTTPRGRKDLLPVFRVGEVHGQTTRRVTELMEVVSAVDTVKITNNLWGERWSKLCVNAMRNPLSAASGLSGNDIDRNPVTRAFGIRLGGQAVRIGQALGYELEHIYNIEPEPLARASEGEPEAVEEANRILLEATKSTARSDLQRPSMAQDIGKGRKTEIDFINGVVAEKGRALGLPVDAHEKIIGLVKGIEQGTVKPSPDHFA